VSLVDGIFRDFTNHQHHFGTYRKIIKNEKDYFNQSVKRFLEVL
jgi:hypothetical protein